jgi:hypothetical protein
VFPWAVNHRKPVPVEDKEGLLEQLAKISNKGRISDNQQYFIRIVLPGLSPDNFSPKMSHAQEVREKITEAHPFVYQE